MRRVGIALAAALVIGQATQAFAADYVPPLDPSLPPPPPAPMTCMDYVNAHYSNHGGFLSAPFYSLHALLCRTFHHEGHTDQY